VESSNNGPPPASKTGGEDNRPVEVILASWVDRFVAWLIDYIIVSIGLGILFVLIAFPFWLSSYSNDMALEHSNFGPFHYLLSSIAFFAYWTYFEHTSGQSIGKRLLNIKATDMSGKAVDIKSATLESFGKSFLLQLDVVLGWLFTIWIGSKRLSYHIERCNLSIMLLCSSIVANLIAILTHYFPIHNCNLI
jgi:uncharacterized RDD family membrane protein YckC